MAKLLDITGRLENNRYTFNLRLPQGSTRKSKIGTYGYSIAMYHDITGNCQVGAIQVAQKLVHLSVPEFIEFWDTIYFNRPVNWEAPWYKSSVMIDVHNQYVDRLIYRFNKIGAHVRLRKKYKNRTGSNMTILVIDLKGKREGVDF